MCEDLDGLTMAYRSLQPYNSPAWAKELKIQPTSRVVLTQQPTPIHEWAVPGVPSGFQLHIKREDLTGSTLSGNKVRKLEFIIADALSQGCDTVVTLGGLQSNHCRATAIAAREVGLNAHTVVRGENEEDPVNIGCGGNLLLDRLCGATIVVLPPSLLGNGSRDDRMDIATSLAEKNYVQKLRSEGKHPYFIQPGGASEIGTWGYIEGFKEMMEQGVLDRFDDVVLAAGTGGTVCALGIANHLTGSKLKIHGITVSRTLETLSGKVSRYLQALGIGGVSPSNIVDLIDGYSIGYGKSTQEELDLLFDVSTQTGVVLDTTFTVKALRGLLVEMKKNPGRFKGRRILFIHTGGVHSLFSGKLDEIVRKTEATNQVHNLLDLFQQS